MMGSPDSGRSTTDAEGARLLKAGRSLAVLGMVIQRPSYGYELDLRFRRIFGLPAWGWTIPMSSIYAGLDTLKAKGFIEEFEAEDPEIRELRTTTRQPKIHYRATPAGVEAMEAFLATPLPPDPTGEDFLIRVSNGLELDRERLVEMLSEYAESCLSLLGELAAPPPATVTLYESLARRRRELSLQAELTWIDYALAEIRGAQ